MFHLKVIYVFFFTWACQSSGVSKSSEASCLATTSSNLVKRGWTVEAESVGTWGKEEELDWPLNNSGGGVKTIKELLLLDLLRPSIL